MDKKDEKIQKKLAKAQNQRSKELAAVRIIERGYISYRDRQMFTMLKHAIRAAEESWTYDVIRKISPKEAELLKDSCLTTKIRFRFGGVEFPPYILFKIYLSNQTSHYYSGKNQIKPTSEAAVQALQQMGHRRFYDQMIIDACQYEKDKIIDEVDVQTKKDYLQYQSNIDERPTYLGGKGNFWRKLSLENLPRSTIIYHIVDYLQTKTMSKSLKENMKIIMSRPVTREIQQEQFNIVAHLQSPSAANPDYLWTYRSKIPKSAASGRRSLQSRRRISKMRSLYRNETEQTVENYKEKEQVAVSIENNDMYKNLSKKQETVLFVPKNSLDSSELEIAKTQHQQFDENLNEVVGSYTNHQAAINEQEASQLYEWTRQLDLNDLDQ